MLAAGYRYIGFIRSLKTVADNNLTARCKGIKAVFIGSIHMLQRIFTPPYIEGIAVRQECLAALRLNYVHNNLGIIGAQIGQVARLAKMNLDGRILFLKVNIGHPRFFDQILQLLEQIHFGCRSHIGKIDLCFFHKRPSCFFFLLHSLYTLERAPSQWASSTFCKKFKSAAS